jgi:hypothetical protein
MAAQRVSNVGSMQLGRAIDRLATVNECTNLLINQGLNDRQFTLCYLDIVEVVNDLREIQSALVDTTAWRVALAHSVFAMLDVSLHYSVNALVTQEDYDQDPLAVEGISEWRRGMAQLQSGAVDDALNTYMANRCRVVRIYNAYYHDPENVNLQRIDEQTYCQ